MKINLPFSVGFKVELGSKLEPLIEPAEAPAAGTMWFRVPTVKNGTGVTEGCAVDWNLVDGGGSTGLIARALVLVVGSSFLLRPALERAPPQPEFLRFPICEDCSEWSSAISAIQCARIEVNVVFCISTRRHGTRKLSNLIQCQRHSDFSLSELISEGNGDAKHCQRIHVINQVLRYLGIHRRGIWAESHAWGYSTTAIINRVRPCDLNASGLQIKSRQWVVSSEIKRHV